MKPDLFDFRAVHDMQVKDVASLIFETNARRPLDGVTFSGGEPFEQALALSELAAMVRGAGLKCARLHRLDQQERDLHLAKVGWQR